MPPSDIGSALAAIRFQAGLTPAELSRLIGLSQASVSRIEAGKQQPPLPVVRRWAAACGREATLLFPAPGDASLRADPEAVDALALMETDPEVRRRVKQLVKLLSKEPAHSTAQMIATMLDTSLVVDKWDERSAVANRLQLVARSVALMARRPEVATLLRAHARALVVASKELWSQLFAGQATAEWFEEASDMVRNLREVRQRMVDEAPGDKEVFSMTDGSRENDFDG